MQPRPLCLSTYLDVPVDQVVALLMRPSTLERVSAPLLRFEPTGDPFPDSWSEGTWQVRLKGPFGLPLGWQDIRVSFPPAPPGAFCVHDAGRGALTRQWDHLITVAPEEKGTRYADQVTVDAGWLTPVVAGFARIFYAHRQRQWRALARELRAD